MRPADTRSRGCSGKGLSARGHGSIRWFWACSLLNANKPAWPPVLPGAPRQATRSGQVEPDLPGAEKALENVPVESGRRTVHEMQLFFRLFESSLDQVLVAGFER